MGVGSLRARVANTVYLNVHHRVLVFQGDGVQDVTITNNSGATVTIYNGSRTSSNTSTIANGANSTFATPYQLWASTGSGPMTVIAGSGLAVDDLAVLDDLTVTDDVTMDALTTAGVLTTSAGIAGGQQVHHATFHLDSATGGTDTACDNGSIWAASVFVPANCTLTGVQYLVGSVGGTDKVIVGLYNNAGTLVANSALAGATVGTAAQIQQVAFTGTYSAVGPARYFVAVQFNGATAKLRTIPAYIGLGTTRIKQAGTFGTMAALSPVPSANVADVGAIASTY